MADPKAGRLVLVVEDDRDTRDLYVQVLNTHGMLGVHAETGTRAMEMAQSARFDAVVVDRLLPDMDGIDLCVKLREKLGGHGTVLVVLSGRAPDADGLPCDAYLVKPVVPDRLIGTLQELFAKRS